MGTISRTAARCQQCPDRNICQGKRMELCRHVDEPTEAPTTSLAGASFINTAITIDPAVNSGLIDEALLQMSVRVLEEKEKERRRGAFCRW